MKTNLACPTDETLIDFLENRLSGNERERVEQHLARCADCRESVVVFTDLEASDVAMVQMPNGLTERAVDAIVRNRNRALPHKMFHKARQLMERGAAVLDRLSWHPEPQMALRSGVQAHSPVIRREKSFGGFRVAIEVASSGAGRAVVRITGDPGQAAAAVRATLLENDREAASGVVGQSPLIFDEIPPGVYVLVFFLPDGDLGEYAFEIMDQPDRQVDETD